MLQQGRLLFQLISMNLKLYGLPAKNEKLCIHRGRKLNKMKHSLLKNLAKKLAFRCMFFGFSLDVGNKRKLGLTIY